MGILSWVILGAIAGAIAKAIMKKEMSGGKTVLLGIVGGVVGGWVMSLINKTGVNGINIWSAFVAVVGACIVLYIAAKLEK